MLFSQPAFDPAPDGVFFTGQGQIKIEIQSQLNYIGVREAWGVERGA